MTTLSYTKVTQAAEAEIHTHLEAAAKDEEGGNEHGAMYSRAAANGVFDLWQTLALQHLDAIKRASYSADFKRLYALISPGAAST